MEEAEMAMSKEELKTWIRDQVENTRLISPGLLEKYNLLHSLLKRREKQASNFLKLCQSVAACEEIVKELYAFLEWEYKDSDSDDESTGCTLQLQAKQHFDNSATSYSSDSQLSKSKAKKIKKTGHPIINRKAVVVLTRLSRSQLIRAVRRPPPQCNFRENESLSGSESDMQWQPGDESSDSDSSLSDFNTGSRKRRKIQQKSKTRESSPPASGGSGKFAAVIDGAKTRRLTARKSISTPIKKTSTPHTSSNTCVNGKTAETILRARTRKTTTLEVNTIKTKNTEANAVQTITHEANATTKTCEANAMKTKTSGANSTKSKTSESNATKTKTSGANSTKIKTSESSAMKTKTSGANSTKTKTSEGNSTKSKTSESNATKTKTSGANSTKTKTSESSAMKTKTSGANSTKTKTSESSTTKTKTSGANATKTKTSESNATKTSGANSTKTSGANATKTKTSGANSTKTSGANSTKTKTSGANATKTKTSEANSTKTSEANSMKTKTSEPNATKTKTSEPNATKTKTSEANAMTTKTSEANSTKTKTSEANATKTKTSEANTKASAERKEATTSTPSAKTTVKPLNQGAAPFIRTAPILPPGEVTMNMKVLARKRELSWQLGTINEIITKDDGRLKYKVIFEKGKSLVSGHHIAFEYSPAVEQLFIGARVVVQYTAEKPEFMPGIMAELPNRKNRMRFLVFIDNHTPVYVGLPLLRLVCKPLADPLNDITEQTHQSYMREYLKHWPHPPQTQYKVGQPVKVEYNGTPERCEVVSIDCSLMEVSFKSDQHKEWLYRGSMRLDDMSDMRRKMVSNKDD